MIAYITGELIEESGDSLIINVNGVGYQLTCSQNTIDDFFAQKNVRAWVYTHVREDALMLFGFSTKLEKQLFESLISVNGVGPKMASKILSGAPLARITECIERADIKGLTQIPKVGKKTAEQIVLTLKGKLQLTNEHNPSVQTPSTELKKVQSALLNLGFKSAEVEKAIARLPQDIGFEEGVREGLAMLSSV